MFSASIGLMTLLLSLAVILPHWPAVQGENRDLRKQLYDYLLAECCQHFQQRRREVKQLQSAENIPLTAAQAEGIFRPTVEAYRRCGSADRFSLRPPNW